MSLFTYESRVRAEWCDYNGHLRDSWYGHLFADAIDALMDDVKIDAAYRTRTKGTIYTLESHIWFILECHEGAPLRVETRLLDADHKRMHVWQEMVHGETGARLAAQESMLLHVSQVETPPRSAPFGVEVQAEVDARLAAHKRLEPPSLRAAVMGIRRKD